MTYGYQSPAVVGESGLLLNINDAGEVVGFFDYIPGINPGFPFSDEPVYGYPDIGNGPSNYGNDNSHEGALSNTGLTGGFFIDLSGNKVGYIDQGQPYTVVTDPNTPASDTASGTAFNDVSGINDSGLAVAFRYEASTGRTFGYTYDMTTGAYAALSFAGASDIQPNDINDSGVIVGVDVVSGVAEGFIDQGGAVTQLTGPAGATASSANGLNDVGQVVGDYVDAAGNTHGFVYDVASSVYTTVDNPDDADGYSSISGINDQGQIVGTYDSGGFQYGFLGTPQGVLESIANPLAGLTLAVGYGSTGLAVGGDNAVTLFDPGYGDMTFFGNAGDDTFQVAFDSQVAGDVWVGGPGDNTFFASPVGYATEDPTTTIYLGSGHNTVVSDGEAEVVGGAGTDTVYDPRTVFAGSGSMTVVGSIRTSYPVVVGGAGTLTTYFGAADAEAFGGTGQGTFVGTGDTFVVGDGPSTVYADGDSDVFLQGSANVLVDDTAAYGADLGFIGEGSSGADTFYLGQGNVYLTLGSGPNAVFLGAGVTDAFAGAGADTFTVAAGQAGGQTELDGFRPGIDLVKLVGYAAGTAQTALDHASVQGGSTYVTLADNTMLDFVGITGLPSSAFG